MRSKCCRDAGDGSGESASAKTHQVRVQCEATPGDTKSVLDHDLVWLDRVRTVVAKLQVGMEGREGFDHESVSLRTAAPCVMVKRLMQRREAAGMLRAEQSAAMMG